MLSEWSRHSATQLQWPSNEKTWTAVRLEKVEDLYCRLIEELHFFEPIYLFVDDLKIRDHVMQKLSGRAVDLDRVIVHQQATGNVWARDCGPFFVKNGHETVILDHNAEKELLVEMDISLPKYVSEKFGVSRVDGELILNNTWLDSNGAGALLVLESTMLEANGKIGLSKPEIEKRLKQYLGIEEILWLKSGSKNQDAELTVRWLNENTVLVTTYDDRDDSKHVILQENLELLKSVSFENGKKLNIETLPQIRIKKTGDSKDDPVSAKGSYIGFYIANGAVFVPNYGMKEDAEAMELFKKYFPGRKIIGIECTDLALVNGSIRRITLPWFGTKAKMLS